jgi:hypothetical protein
MVHKVRISDATMTRLKACAEPFLDKEPEDVIRRLLNEHENNGGGQANSRDRSYGAGTEDLMEMDGPKTKSRVPRERGATVEIAGRQIQGATVPDLYKQALALFVDKHEHQLRSLLPFRTSGQRYLVARERKHQRGNPFIIPVEHHGYFMEAHKDYKNAIEHLGKLARRLGLSFKYVR